MNHASTLLVRNAAGKVRGTVSAWQQAVRGSLHLHYKVCDTLCPTLTSVRLSVSHSYKSRTKCVPHYEVRDKSGLVVYAFKCSDTHLQALASVELTHTWIAGAALTWHS